MHEAGARILQRGAPDSRPGNEVRRPLDQRAARCRLAQAILEVRYGMALGVGDDRVYAPCRQPVDEREKTIAQRSGSRLDQNPTAATEWSASQADALLVRVSVASGMSSPP